MGDAQVLAFGRCSHDTVARQVRQSPCGAFGQTFGVVVHLAEQKVDLPFFLSGKAGACIQKIVDVVAVALGAGHAPALVWGCSRRPSFVSAAISLRSVALDTACPNCSASRPLPTGSPSAPYSVTIARSTRRFRSSIGTAHTTFPLLLFSTLSVRVLNLFYNTFLVCQALRGKMREFFQLLQFRHNCGKNRSMRARGTQVYSPEKPFRQVAVSNGRAFVQMVYCRSLADMIY